MRSLHSLSLRYIVGRFQRRKINLRKSSLKDSKISFNSNFFGDKVKNFSVRDNLLPVGICLSTFPALCSILEVNLLTFDNDLLTVDNDLLTVRFDLLTASLNLLSADVNLLNARIYLAIARLNLSSARKNLFIARLDLLSARLDLSTVNLC